MKIINPKKTTICINNFFLETNFSDSSEKSKIGKPNKEGMYDVKELLSLMKLIIIPHNIRSRLYKIEKISILNPKTLKIDGD
tara:strand:+ start:4164 stop:4409 length:246 start_codon:yes stop_codon:yes gene_type:complete